MRWCILTLGVVVAVVVRLVLPTPCEHCIDVDSLLDEYDYIVVGAGSAGSLIAAELSADPSVTVLLVESGGATNAATLSEQGIPGLAADNVAHKSIDWNFQLNAQEVELRGKVSTGFPERRIPIPRGRVVGGSNELNFMLNVRATKGDYNSWAEAAQDESWGSDNMFKLVEEYERKIGLTKKGHGKPATHPASLAFVDAAGRTKWGNVTEYNSERTVGAYHAEHAAYLGTRASTARTYLLPVMEERRARLHVLINADVVKITVDEDKVARGVIIACGGQTVTVPAAKEIVISAGSYGSPKLLMLSGIGPREHLSAVGVKTVVDLPGVGSNLQDHPTLPTKWRLGEAGGAWRPATLTKQVLFDIPDMVNYFKNGVGQLMSSGADVGMFAHSNESYSSRPDIQVHGMPCAGDGGFYEQFLGFSDQFRLNIGESSDYNPLFAQGYLLAVTVLHPQAVGHVRLADADPASPPSITYEAFAHQEDNVRLVAGVRMAQEVMKEYRGMESTMLFHRDLAEEFGEDSDEYWVEFAKRFGFLLYHPTGTCRMGTADDPAAVVDSKLRVLGVHRLRVADASIMPEISSGNTQSPTASIALKAVKMMQE